MALYKGFSSNNYGTCNGITKTVGFRLTDVDLVKRDILNHIFTRPGERVMMPTFGTIIPDILFEPLDDIILATIEEEIIKVIEADPRTSLISVDVTPDYDGNSVTATVVLNFIELNIVDNIVFGLQFE